MWDAALVLVKFLEVHPSLVAGLRVLELGAGPGAVGVAAAALGAAAVTLTDLPRPLLLAAQNIQANGLSHVATVAPLSWGETLDHLQGGPFDIVLASDCLYQAEACPPFVNTLHALLTARPRALAVLCNEHRPRLPFPEPLFAAAGFALRRVPLSAQHPEWSSQDIHLYLARLPGPSGSSTNSSNTNSSGGSGGDSGGTEDWPV